MGKSYAMGEGRHSAECIGRNNELLDLRISRRSFRIPMTVDLTCPSLHFADAQFFTRTAKAE